MQHCTNLPPLWALNPASPPPVLQHAVARPPAPPAVPYLHRFPLNPATPPPPPCRSMLSRGRLPPLQYFVEQGCEGVLKPDTWAAHDDPFDQETEDEEGEEFQHV